MAVLLAVAHRRIATPRQRKRAAIDRLLAVAEFAGEDCPTPSLVPGAIDALDWPKEGKLAAAAADDRQAEVAGVPAYRRARIGSPAPYNREWSSFMRGSPVRAYETGCVRIPPPERQP